MTQLNPDGVPSDAPTPSQSPLSQRRGNADADNIGQGPLNLDFEDRGYDDNPRQSLAPQEPGDAVPPSETFPEPQGSPPDRSPVPPSEPGQPQGVTDGEQADLAFKRLGK